MRILPGLTWTIRTGWVRVPSMESVLRIGERTRLRGLVVLDGDVHWSASLGGRSFGGTGRSLVFVLGFGVDVLNRFGGFRRGLSHPAGGREVTLDRALGDWLSLRS